MNYAHEQQHQVRPGRGATLGVEANWIGRAIHAEATRMGEDTVDQVARVMVSFLENDPTDIFGQSVQIDELVQGFAHADLLARVRRATGEEPEAD